MEENKKNSALGTASGATFWAEPTCVTKRTELTKHKGERGFIGENAR